MAGISKSLVPLIHASYSSFVGLFVDLLQNNPLHNLPEDQYHKMGSTGLGPIGHIAQSEKHQQLHCIILAPEKM